jgi:hypothetical protein
LANALRLEPNNTDALAIKTTLAERGQNLP